MKNTGKRWNNRKGEKIPDTFLSASRPHQDAVMHSSRHHFYCKRSSFMGLPSLPNIRATSFPFAQKALQCQQLVSGLRLIPWKMNFERNVSVEEPSGETPAEMKDSRMGQEEKLSSQGPQAGPLHFPRTCGWMGCPEEGHNLGRGNPLWQRAIFVDPQSNTPSSWRSGLSLRRE